MNCSVKSVRRRTKYNQGTLCLVCNGHISRLQILSWVLDIYLSCSCLWRTGRWSGTESVGRSSTDACWTLVSGRQTGSAGWKGVEIRTQGFYDCINAKYMNVGLGSCWVYARTKVFFFYKLHNVLQIRKDKYIAVSREGDQLCVHSHFKKDNETMRLLSTGGKVQQFILVVWSE